MTEEVHPFLSEMYACVGVVSMARLYTVKSDWLQNRSMQQNVIGQFVRVVVMMCI